MKKLPRVVSIALLAAPLSALGQYSGSTNMLISADPAPGGGPTASAYMHAGTAAGAGFSPFSGIAFGASTSPLGIGFQVAANINQHLNVRGAGNFLNYSTTFTTQGIAADGKLNMRSAGASLDYYPFHNGFRVSPGLLFFNGNQLAVTDTIGAGQSFTLDNQTFYSANANPATGAIPANGSALLALNKNKPAFTVTAGWGNMISRTGGHLSFPFEIGVAFIGEPSLTANLGGWACYDQAQTQCTNLSSNNPIANEVQADLQAQVAKWNYDLSPLRTYPIVSGGVAYSFAIRRQ